jgi:3-oxoacyl-[acyl-carrier protein] reductase
VTEAGRAPAARTALVTGASRGIGAAVARRLAADGFRVAVLYHRSREEAERVAGDCRRAGVRAAAVQADVRSGDSLAALKAELERLDLEPDTVVHSAGVARTGLLHDLGEAEWDDLLAVHLKAAYWLAKLFSPGMVWRRWGRIVHISSVWGLVGASGEVAYSAAKGGLNSFTKGLAKELAPSGVTVNAVAPGAIRTEMLRTLSDDDLAGLAREIPLGRLGEPEEVAELVRYLVSPEAGYVTGQVISLSGGWH